MASILFIFCLTLFSQIFFGQSTNKEYCEWFEDVCRKQTNCIECISAHECCHFCYDKETKTSQCRTDIDSCKHFIKNKKSKATLISDQQFSDINENNEAVQIKPQKVKINLHQNRPFNFTFTYKPAKNYSLDLYYMTDITSSMAESIKDMSKLGNELSNTLDSLTSRYRIAFGTYMDKIEMPFYPTDKEHIDNPCKLFGETCAKGVFFKHALSFTKNITQFIEQVNLTTTSANVDDMEGGFDALMQVLLCNETIGWGQSRKIILFVTGSVMHFAGDGLLAGAVKRNRKQCFINANGDYTVPHNLFDYPSLEEVYHEMVEKKVNLIIASKRSSYDYYEQLRQVISSNTYLGKLDDTAEVAKHIQDGYYKFTEEVAFSPIFAGNSSDIKIDFFSKCNGKRMMKTSKCNGIKVNQEIEFIAEIRLDSKYPKNKYELTIEEKNIAENIKIEIDVIETDCQKCKVSKLDCTNGRWDCCQCDCFDEWTGPTCSETCSTSVDACRYEKDGVLQATCSGLSRGECSCGKCNCYVPFNGKFCEYICPIDPITRRVCGGPNNGNCVNDTCICHPNFTGEFCTCSILETNCKTSGKDECNGRGKCKCNKCECDAGFSGEFCEVCDVCSAYCDVYKKCIGKHLTSESATDCRIEQASIPIEDVNEFSGRIHNITCYHRFTNNENKTCDVQFGYELSRSEIIKLQVLPVTCSDTRIFNAYVAGPILAAIIVGGLIAICAVKGVNTYRDHREYIKFQNQQKFKVEGSNPLYKEVRTHYRVPDSVRFSD